MKRYVEFFEKFENSEYKKKDIIIYGAGINGTLLFEGFKKINVNILYFIDNRLSKEVKSNSFKGIPIYDSLKLSKDHTENELIVVSPHHIPFITEINKQLENMGYQKNKEYINFVPDEVIRLNSQENYFDPFLGFSQKYDIEGFRISGEENSKNKIIVLGNCTSLQTIEGQKSWVDYLYEHLLESKKGDFCIYNGACPGYSSSQELLKLERDCLVLKPTMVIILNGVIDAMNTGVQEGYPFFTRFEFDIIKKIFAREDIKTKYNDLLSIPSKISFGLEEKCERWESYIRNIRMMRGILTEFNIPFFCFLQPSLFSEGGGALSEKEVDMFNIMYPKSQRVNESNPADNHICLRKKATEFYKQVKLQSKQIDCLYDLTGSFKNSRDTFCDEIHYYEKGHKIIAEQIWSFLMIKEQFI